jgi:hypothetical protein
MPRILHCLLLAAPIILPSVMRSQVIPLNPPTHIQVCPGAFPTDLTATDCRYKLSQRSLDFLNGSVTDQAVLSAVVFGLGAQIIESPSEWKRTWGGYGDRVGSRYTQAVGKGTAQYLVGLVLKDDPRFVAYRDDPGVIRRRRDAICGLSERSGQAGLAPCQNNATGNVGSSLTHDGWKRFGHAWYDVITVRRSTIDGNGKRIPALSRFSGEFAGAYAGYPWYPGAENTFPKVGERAAGAFGTAVLSSFYTEYKPEITNLLGAVFRRGRSKSKAKDQP